MHAEASQYGPFTLFMLFCSVMKKVAHRAISTFSSHWFAVLKWYLGKAQQSQDQHYPFLSVCAVFLCVQTMVGLPVLVRIYLLITTGPHESVTVSLSAQIIPTTPGFP